MRSRWHWTVLGVAVLALAVWLALGRGQTIEVEVATAKLGAIESPFIAEGIVKGNAVEIEPEATGRVEQVLVREGEAVKSGQALVRLRSEELSSSVQQAEASLRTAQERVNQAEHVYGLSKKNVRARIDQARARKLEAEAALKVVLAGPRQEEVSQAEQRVRQAEALEGQAKTEMDRAQRLYDQGALPLADLQRAKTAFATAQSQTRVAREALEMLKKGATPEQVAAAQAAVQVAQSTLDAANASSEEVDVEEHELAAARANAATARAALGTAKAALSRATVTAPFDGTVSHLPVKVGDTASPGRVLLTLVGADVLTVEAEIGDQDFSKVSVGQQVEVTSASSPGKTLYGSVSRIAQDAVQKPGTVLRTRVLRATIVLNAEATEMRAGMEVDVHGTGTIAARALTVPSRALVTSGEAQSVWVLQGDSVQARSVKVGAYTFESVQILEGLSEGEEVVVSPPEGLTAGQRVRRKGA